MTVTGIYDYIASEVLEITGSHHKWLLKCRNVHTVRERPPDRYLKEHYFSAGSTVSTELKL